MLWTLWKKVLKWLKKFSYPSEVRCFKCGKLKVRDNRGSEEKEILIDDHVLGVPLIYIIDLTEPYCCPGCLTSS